MTDALIVEAVRSTVGRRNGTLASVRADELAGEVLDGLVRRTGSIRRGRGRADGLRHADRRAGAERGAGRAAGRRLAGDRLGVEIDRQCGSSMQAAFKGSAAIQAGHLDVIVAAGVESMSRVPMGSNLRVGGFTGF